jgi:hypothetical protein
VWCSVNITPTRAQVIRPRSLSGAGQPPAHDRLAVAADRHMAVKIVLIP